MFMWEHSKQFTFELLVQTSSWFTNANSQMFKSECEENVFTREETFEPLIRVGLYTHAYDVSLCMYKHAYALICV